MDKSSTNIYTRFASGILFPIHEWVKGHRTLANLKELEITQWLPPERLSVLRLGRLRRFLASAGEQVPYYKRVFKEIGFDAKSIVSLQDLSALPILTKSLIKEHLSDLIAAESRGICRFNTGGSTGEPLIFYIGKERVSHDVAAKWRATRWWGVDVGDPEIVVWGSPIELAAQDRIRTWRDRILRTRLLSAFEMSPEKLNEYVATIRRFNPRMLFGYPSAISLIARHAQAMGQAADNFGIEVVFVTAEQLYDHQREEIEHIFGCRVASGYGGRDSGFIAHECPDGGMHISAEDVIVEIVDERGNVLPPGGTGEIVVTHLATSDFPFIRYRTGDVAVMDDGVCACGRSLPLLKEIHGRTTDFITAKDGTVMHALALIYVIRDVPGVQNFKIIQENLETIRVQLVKTPAFDPKNEDAIRNGITRRVGAGVKIILETLRQIPPEASGKHRYVVSRIAQELASSGALE